MKKPKLSIILVNWNCGQVILNCINSLQKTIKKYSYEIIVVDNNSKDGSVEFIQRKFPKVKVIKNKFNNMFAGANNQGYAVSEGDYIFILNSDTVVIKGSVDALLDYLIKNKKDVVTCTLLNKDGTIQKNMHRGFPSVMRLFTSKIYQKYGILGFLPSVKNYLSLNNKFDKDFYVEQAPGSAILISKKLINRLGCLFDEKNFPLFYNDVDLCYRINKLGIKILCKTDVMIYHLKGDAINKIGRHSYFKNTISSSLNFFRKHKKYFDYYILLVMGNVFLFLQGLIWKRK